jgi:hypothetical protein
VRDQERHNILGGKVSELELRSALSFTSLEDNKAETETMGIFHTLKASEEAGVLGAVRSAIAWLL